MSRAEAQTGALPCIRYGELYTVHADCIREFHSWISPEVAKGATRLRTGDVVFAASGETKEDIGRSAAFVGAEEAYAGGDILVLRQDEALPLFLGYAVNAHAVARQKASLGQGDAVVHIGIAALSRITVDLPPLHEQRAIATVLADMDEEIEALEQRVEKLRAVKRGMMQQLLTGRIRLPRMPETADRDREAADA